MDSFVMMAAVLGGAVYRRRRRRRLWLTFAPEAWRLRTQQRLQTLHETLVRLRSSRISIVPRRHDDAYADAVRRIDALIAAQQREHQYLTPDESQYSEHVDRLMGAYLWRVYALQDGDTALLTVTDRQIAAFGQEALAAQQALPPVPRTSRARSS